MNSRGKLPLEFIIQLVKDLGYRTYYELKRKVENREEWRNAASQPAFGLLTKKKKILYNKH
jgi:hypothetical protein